MERLKMYKKPSKNNETSKRNSAENRAYNLKFRVTQEERIFIEKKCEISGCKNMSDYLRKMAVTGMVIKYDMQTLKELNQRISSISNNINQIAVQVNSHGRIYSDDIEEMKGKVDEIWQSLKSIQSALQLD